MQSEQSMAPECAKSASSAEYVSAVQVTTPDLEDYFGDTFARSKDDAALPRAVALLPRRHRSESSNTLVRIQSVLRTASTSKLARQGR